MFLRNESLLENSFYFFLGSLSKSKFKGKKEALSPTVSVSKLSHDVVYLQRAHC